MEEPVSPPSSKKKVLYLFAGTDRRTSIRSVLRRFSSIQTDQEIECEEWDICRGPQYDLLDEEVQQKLLRRIEAGEFMVVLLSPPCASWSRAPWANRWGPRPLRTALHPWGLPWLEGDKLKKVADSNSMIRFCLRILEVAIRRGLGVLLEHPENLGSVRSRPSPTVRPASIWELQELTRLQGGEVFTVAFYQCQFGAKSRKPTRILSNLQPLRLWGWTSWPRLNAQGCYVGPLPLQCSCGRSHQGLIKRSADDAFATTEAAAYPEQMDLQIAWALWKLPLPPSPSPTAGPVGGREEKEEGEGEAQANKRRKGAEEEGEPSLEEIEELIEEAKQSAEEEMEKREKDLRSREEEKGLRKLAPIPVHYKGRVRNMVDGLGKCSPGIRRAGFRGGAEGPRSSSLGAAFMQEVMRIEEAMDQASRQAFIAKLVLGKFSSSPFDEVIEGVRERLDEKVRSLGKDPRRKPDDRDTVVNFRRLKAWAQILEDEDHLFLEGVASLGVPLGVRGEIPWVSRVYDRKEKGEKDEAGLHSWVEDSPGETLRDNYSSATSHLDKVKKIVEEEEKKGWIKRMPLSEAKEIYGEDLQVASLGAVPKDPGWEEVRVVHDGTHGIQVNTEIKQPNRMTFPQFDDLEAAAGALEREGARERMLFAFDIKAAHRLIPVQKKDWALQSFRLEDTEELWVNMVGTFGVASAAFWWGRVASVIFRSFHRVVPRSWLFYLLLFADDGLLMAAGPEYHRVALALFLFMDVMEVPLSWKKTRGGFRVEWIGYTVDLEQWKVGISERKVQWLEDWSRRLMEESHLLGREFRAGVGRLGFLAGAISGARPFLAPLYAVASRVGGSGYVELHMAIKLALAFFTSWIAKEPMRKMRRPPRVAGEVFRIDAAADHDGISIGGWEVHGGKKPEEARWFSVQVTRRTFPWLYLKGEPFRTIAAAELLAVTVAVMAFKEKAPWRNADGRFSITGFTDNASNSFVVDKYLSTKFPVSLVLMELAYQLGGMEVSLNLHWIPREQNEEADDLSKGRFEKFDPKKRIEVDLEKMDFKIIPVLAEVAGRLDEEIRLKKVSKEKKHPEKRTPAEEKLRMKEPW